MCSSLQIMTVVLKWAIHLLLMQQGQFYPSRNTQEKPIGFTSDPDFKLWAFCFEKQFHIAFSFLETAV